MSSATKKVIKEALKPKVEQAVKTVKKEAKPYLKKMFTWFESLFKSKAGATTDVKRDVKKQVAGWGGNLKAETNTTFTKEVVVGEKGWSKKQVKKYNKHIVEPIEAGKVKRASGLVGDIADIQTKAESHGLATKGLESEVGSTLKGTLAEKKLQSLGVDIKPTATYKELGNMVYKAQERIEHTNYIQKMIIEHSSHAKPATVEKVIKKKIRASIVGKGKKAKAARKALENKSLLEIVESGTNKELSVVSQELYNEISVNRRVAFGQLIESFGTSPILSEIYNVKKNTDNLYRVLKSNGFENAASVAKGMFNAFDNIQQIETQSKNYGINIGKEWRSVLTESAKTQGITGKEAIALHIDNRSKIVREYITKARKEVMEEVPLERKAGELVDNLIVDSKLAIELGMKPEELQLAGKTVNILRRSSHAFAELEKGTYSIHESMPSYNTFTKKIDLTHMDMQASSSSMGDAGMNYFPSKAKWAKEAGKSGRTYSGEEVRAGFQKSKSSVNQLKEEARLSPIEELENYYSEYSNTIGKSAGRAKLNELAASLTTDNIAGVGTANKMSVSEVESKFRPLVDNIADGFNNAYKSSGELHTGMAGVIEKGIYTVADVNTAAALTNPVLAFWNTLQPVTNTSALVEFKHLFGAYRDVTVELAKGSGKIAKDMRTNAADVGLANSVANDMWIESGVDMLQTGKLSSTVKKSLNFYFGNKRVDIMENHLHTMNSKLRTFMNIVTMPFKMSDVGARVVAITASARQAEAKAMPYFRKGYSEGGFKKLSRELHLDALYAADADNLMLLYKSGQSAKFIASYAAMVVDKTLYNYSKFGTPQFLERMKGHQAAQRIFRFQSWNMHYLDMASGVSSAYMAGDKEPARRMGMAAIAWLATLGVAAQGAEDGGRMESALLYGLGRTPIGGPGVGVVSQGLRAPLGMLTHPVALIGYPFVATMDNVVSAVSGSEKTPFSWSKDKLYQQGKSQPAVKRIIDATEFFMGE